MRTLMWKSRISLLWMGAAVLTLMHMLLTVVEPGAIDDLRAGTIEGMDTAGPATALWALFVLVPLAMAVLTLALPRAADRWVNGTVALLLAVAWLPESLGPTLGAVIVNVAVVVAALVIAWHAWKWPVEERTPETPAPVEPTPAHTGRPD